MAAKIPGTLERAEFSDRCRRGRSTRSSVYVNDYSPETLAVRASWVFDEKRKWRYFGRGVKNLGTTRKKGLGRRSAEFSEVWRKIYASAGVRRRDGGPSLDVSHPCPVSFSCERRWYGMDSWNFEWFWNSIIGNYGETFLLSLLTRRRNATCRSNSLGHSYSSWSWKSSKQFPPMLP